MIKLISRKSIFQITNTVTKETILLPKNKDTWKKIQKYIKEYFNENK